MATWSISVSERRAARPSVWAARGRSCAVPAEEGDPVLADLLPELGVVDAEALLGGQAQHADLALVQVVVDLVGGLADVGRAGSTAERIGWILPSAMSWLAVPRLAVVGEVASD